MADKATGRKVSDKSTKQEVLEAYQTLAKKIDEKRAGELNPEKQIELKKAEEAIKTADAISTDTIDRSIGNLKADIGMMLAEVSDKLAGEVRQYQAIRKAVETRQKDLQELYGIEKAAATLAALIESQNEKRREFEAELVEQKDTLNREIEAVRDDWDQEKKRHELEIKERDTVEKKARDREKEEFYYVFKREQQGVKDQLRDEKLALEKEILVKKETAAKELAEREKAIATAERELAELRQKAAAFPKELETTVAKAVLDATEKIKLESKNREELARKEFEGQRNVFTTRIESLDRAVKELTEQNTRATKQLEIAYQKVQDIAEKAIEGSSQAKSFAELQKMLADQSRKASQDKA